MARGVEVAQELERVAAFEGAARAGGVAGGSARTHGRHAGVGPRGASMGAQRQEQPAVGGIARTPF